MVEPDPGPPYGLEQQWRGGMIGDKPASSSVKVPTRLVWTKGEGSVSELSLWDSAAKWTTASASATSRSTRSASTMSPTTSEHRSAGSSANASSLAA